jgi:hypothetical protein
MTGTIVQINISVRKLSAEEAERHLGSIGGRP